MLNNKDNEGKTMAFRFIWTAICFGMALVHSLTRPVTPPQAAKNLIVYPSTPLIVLGQG